MGRTFFKSNLTIIGFWIPSLLLLSCWALVTYRTRGALAWDGAVEHGFPFAFYQYFCGPLVRSGASNCDYTFSTTYLIVDLFILVTVPLLLNILALRIFNRKKN